MARVLVTRELPAGGTEPLVDAGHVIVARDGDEPYSHDELVTIAPAVDAIICLLTDRIDADVITAGAAGRLRAVANVAVGYDNVDVEVATRCGVAVCNTPGVLDETTADLAFLLILAAARLASTAEADLRNARWPGWNIMQYLGQDVHGATLGLVGFGRIGQAVARRAAGFGMNVRHHTRHDTGISGWAPELDKLVATSDFDARRLALMKPTAVLVNTARGPIVDEAALATALEDGTIFAAGIDVYEREPEVHPRLLAAPRTVLLPHLGSASEATRRRMARLACEGAVAILAGERPPNLVTPSR
ncbi:MAG: D-glycerate dehydrogenase [Actinobacteria bacterium]|nr:MAG: D-glycerate dehydrogenase [Actinomycetota bacterium]